MRLDSDGAPSSTTAIDAGAHPAVSGHPDGWPGAAWLVAGWVVGGWVVGGWVVAGWVVGVAGWVVAGSVVTGWVVVVAGSVVAGSVVVVTGSVVAPPCPRAARLHVYSGFANRAVDAPSVVTIPATTAAAATMSSPQVSRLPGGSD